MHVIKPSKISQAIASLIVLAGTTGIIDEAAATSKIMSANGASSCSTCHTGGAYTKAEGTAGLKAFLATKNPTPTTPTCTAPAVLSGNTCVTPSVPTTPTTPECTAPASLLNGVCVNTQAPSACNNNKDDIEEDDDHDSDDHDHENEGGEHKSKKHSSITKTKPTLSATDKVSVHAGEQLKLAVTAFDCSDRPLKIKATDLPKGASIKNSYDDDLRMQKAVVTWTPGDNLEGQTKALTFKAIANDGGKQTTESTPLAVSVEVLPQASTGAISGNPVKNLVISSARYDSKRIRLDLSGQVKWAKQSTKADRKNATLSPITFTDATTNASLGSTSVNLKGQWRFTLPIDGDLAPCSINANFQSSTVAKPVKGLAHCQ